MGSKMATSGPHAAGIFADMTVDGPEIGTLVLIVDRAKNLPNRKTMGKQNPYCAARLGKEARKTETDRRGGQTPKWDQEIRFTVHDSPDYYQLKISVFSEDKRTDLVGEAWVNLEDVVVPGGGKSDGWQNLNCKGKYAGEIRIELTYYDTREKPEKAEHIVSVAEELQQTYGGLTKTDVKRRPLPVNPNTPSTTPVVIPDRAPPGRAKHGPRDFANPPRAASLPPDGPKTYNYPHSQATLFGNTPVNAAPHESDAVTAPPQPVDPSPPDVYYGEYDPNLGPQLLEPQPDFLPTLGPSRRERESLLAQPRYVERPLAQTYMDTSQPHPPAHPPAHHPAHHPVHPPAHPSVHAPTYPTAHQPAPLPHSHSAPAVPLSYDQYPYQDNGYQLRTDHPEPIPDVDYQYEQVRQRRHDMPHAWEDEYGSGYSDKQPYVEDDMDSSPPPPPPIHSHSSPAVPHYSSYDHSHGPPSRYVETPPSTRQYVPNSSPLQSIERGYGPKQTPPSHRQPGRGESFEQYGGSPPYRHSYGSMPNLPPQNMTTPPSQMRSSHYGGTHRPRHSLQDPYSTPARPHPLSQEVPRARSPNPYAPRAASSSPYQHDYQGYDAPPLIKPRAVSPRPNPEPEPTHERARPKSTYNIQHPIRAFESSDENPLSTSQRAPPPVAHRGSLPRKSVSPRPSMMSEGARASSPYSPDSYGIHNPNAPSADMDSLQNAPIVGWNGQEIDPSDHLPVNSWAPEPEKKTPTKTYGQGRDRDFGPRSQSGVVNSAGRVSKDMVVNVRRRQPDPVPEPQPSKIRARLVQKPGPGSAPPVTPLRDHHNFNPVPNPYEQLGYSRGSREGSPATAMMNYQDGRPEEEYGPPSLPPKVPLADQGYHPDALSREVASIDLGPGRRPGQTAFVPVRSHRDRNSFY